MPRNIMLPEEQQNSPKRLVVPSKGNQKRSSASSNLSDQDTMMESKWKTNLFISDEIERVEKRDQGYRKNTSFENKIINDHIKVMIETVCEVEGNSNIWDCKTVCNNISREESIMKGGGIVKDKVQELIDSNTYLTEDEKSDFAKMFCDNYDNYQILIKTISRLEALSLSRQELTFVLFKIVEFISENYEVKLRKYDEQFMQAQIPKRLSDVSNAVTTHVNVKLINPQYFYNSNENKYMGIIERWFYCIFAIKLGIYTNKYLKSEQQESQMMI